MRKVYLDYAATTPVDKRVVKAMAPFLSKEFGNTMSLHSFGQEAKVALEESRKKIADLINCKASEVVFTGSATESNNMVLKGIKARHIIISAIEHPCIMESAKWIEKQGLPAGRQGVKITRIPVDKYGLVSPEDVKKAITKETGLVSIIHASNEMGTIQPIEKIAKICQEKKVLFHTDASQSFGKIPINLKNIDLLTASSHKIYGPKGSALLFIKEGVKIEPLLHGGGQENGLRSSTVNVPAIVGFAKASEIAFQEMGKESQKLIKLRDYLIKETLKIKNVKLNGHPTKRLSNNINFSFSFIEGESLLLELDLAGIAVSTGSACSSVKLEPSYVLMALGLKHEQAHGSLRVSLGRETKKEDSDYFLKNLIKIVKQLRKISPYGK